MFVVEPNPYDQFHHYLAIHQSYCGRLTDSLKALVLVQATGCWVVPSSHAAGGGSTDEEGAMERVMPNMEGTSVAGATRAFQSLLLYEVVS
jgi:hypothetical protein